MLEDRAARAALALASAVCCSPHYATQGSEFVGVSEFVGAPFRLRYLFSRDADIVGREGMEGMQGAKQIKPVEGMNYEQLFGTSVPHDAVVPAGEGG